MLSLTNSVREPEDKRVEHTPQANHVAERALDIFHKSYENVTRLKTNKERRKSIVAAELKNQKPGITWGNASKVAEPYGEKIFFGERPLDLKVTNADARHRHSLGRVVIHPLLRRAHR